MTATDWQRARLRALEVRFVWSLREGDLRVALAQADALVASSGVSPLVRLALASTHVRVKGTQGLSLFIEQAAPVPPEPPATRALVQVAAGQGAPTLLFADDTLDPLVSLLAAAEGASLRGRHDLARHWLSLCAGATEQGSLFDELSATLAQLAGRESARSQPLCVDAPWCDEASWRARFDELDGRARRLAEAGKLRRALAVAEIARELSSRHDDPPRRVRAGLTAGELLCEAGFHGEALYVLWDAHQRAAGDDEALASSRVGLGRAYLELGQGAQAGQFLRAVPATSPSSFKARLELARERLAAGDALNERLELENARAAAIAQHGERSLAHATCLLRLGESALRQGDAAAAEPLAREGLSLRQALLGPDHAETALALVSLGAILRASSRPADAARAFVEALGPLARERGHADRWHRLAQSAAADALLEQGALDEAEPLVRALHASTRADPLASAPHVAALSRVHGFAQSRPGRARATLHLLDGRSRTIEGPPWALARLCDEHLAYLDRRGPPHTSCLCEEGGKLAYVQLRFDEIGAVALGASLSPVATSEKKDPLGSTLPAEGSKASVVPQTVLDPDTLIAMALSRAAQGHEVSGFAIVVRTTSAHVTTELAIDQQGQVTSRKILPMRPGESAAAPPEELVGSIERGVVCELARALGEAGFPKVRGEVKPSPNVPPVSLGVRVEGSYAGVDVPASALDDAQAFARLYRRVWAAIDAVVREGARRPTPTPVSAGAGDETKRRERDARLALDDVRAYLNGDVAKHFVVRASRMTSDRSYIVWHVSSEGELLREDVRVGGSQSGARARVARVSVDRLRTIARAVVSEELHRLKRPGAAKPPTEADPVLMLGVAAPSSGGRLELAASASQLDALPGMGRVVEAVMQVVRELSEQIDPTMHAAGQAAVGKPQRAPTPSKPRALLARYAGKKAPVEEVMRTLIEHDDWLVPLVYLLRGGGEPVVPRIVLFGDDTRLPQGKIWVFSDEEAAQRAADKGARLGALAGGVQGTAVFATLDDEFDELEVNPGSPREETFFLQRDAFGMGRVWAELVGLERSLSTAGLGDPQTLARARLYQGFVVLYDHAAQRVATIAREGDIEQPALVFSSPDAVDAYLRRLSEAAQKALARATLDGKRLAEYLLSLHVGGAVLNCAGPSGKATISRAELEALAKGGAGGG